MQKPQKEYRLTVLKGSLYKKKFEYKNKDKFLKYLRISTSDDYVLRVEQNQIEIPAEDKYVVKFTLQAEEEKDIQMHFIRYDTDDIEEELVFKITFK